MSFGESVRVVLFEKYATFKGRASRSEYWWWYLFFVLIQSILNAAGLDVLSGVFVVAVLIPHIAVAVRRLHDIGMSGWWAFFYYLTPVVFFVMAMSFASDNVIFLFSGLWIVISLASLVLFCLRGTHGANRYGTDPLR